MKQFNNWDSLPLTLSVDETAKITGYGQTRIRELCRGKKMPCIRLGRAFRIPKEALHTWIIAECNISYSLELGGR
jgi:excisionase family DNA binding protein